MVRTGCLIALIVVAIPLLFFAVRAGLGLASPPAAAQPSPPRAAPISTPTAGPAPAPRPPAITAHVGDRVESAGIALTVNSVKRADSLSQFQKAKPGRQYVVADVTVDNATREKAPYNPLYFKLKDADGYEYTGSLTSGEQSLKSGELAPGEKARGTVAFDVPSDAHGLVVSYQPLVILGGYQPIRVALD